MSCDNDCTENNKMKKSPIKIQQQQKLNENVHILFYDKNTRL